MRAMSDWPREGEEGRRREKRTKWMGEIEMRYHSPVHSLHGESRMGPGS